VPAATAIAERVSHTRWRFAQFARHEEKRTSGRRRRFSSAELRDTAPCGALEVKTAPSPNGWSGPGGPWAPPARAKAAIRSCRVRRAAAPCPPPCARVFKSHPTLQLNAPPPRRSRKLPEPTPRGRRSGAATPREIPMDRCRRRVGSSSCWRVRLRGREEGACETPARHPRCGRARHSPRLLVTLPYRIGRG